LSSFDVDAGNMILKSEKFDRLLQTMNAEALHSNTLITPHVWKWSGIIILGQRG